MTFSPKVTHNLLHNVLDTALNAIVVVDVIQDIQEEVVDFRYVFVNEAARQQASVLKDITVGMTMKEVVSEAHFQGILPVCQMVWLTGQSHQREQYYSHTNEWFDAHIARLDDTHLVITFTNISLFKQSVSKHQQQADLFQSILSSTANPVVVGKPVYRNEDEVIDFQVVLFNSAAKDAWLFGPPLRVGSTATDLLPQSERDLIVSFCRTAYQTGETQRFQYRYPNTDRWFNLVVQRFNKGIILNATDVTEERHQQHNLRQMNLDLQQSNENLQQFAYIASHDLQEPLRKIHSFGNLLHDQFGELLGPVGSDVIQRMQGASGRMTTLIRDLLTYSRLTTHREPFQPVSLGRLLDEIIDDLDPLIQDGQATTECDELPTVPGDATQLRQLFQNLLVNAITFCHPNRSPTVYVRCRTLESHETPTGLSVQERYVEISVNDDGIGFDERYRERIFQMFQRLHGRNQYTGTGVGLAICKRVVENHRGFITANSIAGEGATFRVVLPL